MSLQDKYFPSALLLCLALVTTGCGGSSSGSGGSGGSSPAPAVKLSATSLSFTGVDSGYPTAAQTITLTNSGNASLTLNSEQLSGTDASYFGGVGGGVGGCSAITLAAGASCTTQVVFTPVAARSYSATLTFTDNASNSPQTVALSGTYTAPAGGVAQAKFGYVANYYGQIYSYTISSSGGWTPTSPASAGFGDLPAAIVIDPQDKFLFVVGNNSGDVGSYSINSSTGVLTAAGTGLATVAGNNPNNLAIDPTGTFVYVSNTGNSTVTEYTVNRSTGALTLGGSVTVPLASGVQTGESRPGGLVTDLNGQYLYVSVAGYIVTYAIAPSTGALTQSSTVAGSSCFNLKLDSTGKYLYCAPGGSGMLIYQVNSTTGVLTTVAGIGYAVATGQNATDVAVTPNSKYAYVTDRTDETISLYTDNPTTGYLTPQTPSTVSQYNEPYAIAIDPGSQFAYVVLENSGLAILNINADGTLSSASQLTISTPVAIAIYP